MASQRRAATERHRPGERDQDAERGRDPLAAAKAEPDRKHVAEDRAAGCDERGCGPQPCAINTAAAPLARSSSRVSAASPLLPVRRTLVAPILPEPIRRMSPMAGEPRQQQPERDRAEEIAEQARRRATLTRLLRSPSPAVRERGCLLQGIKPLCPRCGRGGPRRGRGRVRVCDGTQLCRRSCGRRRSCAAPCP